MTADTTQYYKTKFSINKSELSPTAASSDTNNQRNTETDNSRSINDISTSYQDE
jgi:hypothetical protein